MKMTIKTKRQQAADILQFAIKHEYLVSSVAKRIGANAPAVRAWQKNGVPVKWWDVLEARYGRLYHQHQKSLERASAAVE